jgi:hypothetical protein
MFASRLKDHILKGDIMFRNFRKNGEWGTPEQKNVFFKLPFTLLYLFKNSKTYRWRSDTGYDYLPGINISVTLNHSLLLIIGFYKSWELLYESLNLLYK